MSDNPFYKQIQRQTQSQKQVYKLSQKQIQAIRYLSLSTRDLREEIYKFVNENPALEIVSDKNQKNVNKNSDYSASASKFSSYDNADAYNNFLEAQADTRESLQLHLMNQLNMLNISKDEYELSQRLIYNLDKNGCYGSLLSPESLLDKNRPMQTKFMLKNCMERIQQMDPVGTCCRTPEESLFVQAKIRGDASELSLFFLDGHLEFLSPPEPEKILKKLSEFLEDYKKKSFKKNLAIENQKITKADCQASLKYILTLNPHPAGEYVSTSSTIDFEKPDIVVNITKVESPIPSDDFENGRVKGLRDSYFQIKYIDGNLPELRLAPGMNFDSESIERANTFLNSLKFRESSLILQACAIVKSQLEFFEKGPGNIVPFTHRQLAKFLGIHESTVSRMANKKNGKYFQTDWGLFPASYFFASGVNKTSDSSLVIQKISSEAIKAQMSKILSSNENKTISDGKLCEMLNAQGIKIARRTVAKYRMQLGLENSYNRK